ncbi:MAG: 3-carboxy-cis,cis-muconate cycloisomerase [Dongiaceae bacterium]
MSVSVFDHPWLSALLGDDEIARHFGVEAELRAMLEFEIALAMAEAECGIIPMEAARAVAAAALSFQPDMSALAAGTARDGMVVPEWVSQLRRAVRAPHGDHVHFGSTSQDVLDTSLVLRLKPVLGILSARLNAFDSRLAALAADHGSVRTMARTRMQRALPITWADRIAAWRAPLARHQKRLQELAPRLLVVQCGGPVGTLEKLGDKGPSVAAALANRLDLAVPAISWHSARDTLAEFASWLSMVTGALGKIGQDIALLAQNEIADVTVTGAGQSSAMHHKQNPVLAEILVSLARFNATQLSGMHHALVHDQERSGAAWTLEWMILPQMTVAAGASLARGLALLDALRINAKS